MAGYFDEGYYLKSKLAQLQKAGEKDADGNVYTPDTLLQAIHDAGMTPESHYAIHGRTEKLNPNAYFNEVEYLEAKLAQVNSVGETDPDGKPYTPETLIKAIEAAGMTAIEHYEKFGGKEMDAEGNLINPSNAFDANAYATAKLAELMKVEPEKWAGKTAADVVTAIAEAGMTPVSHYDQYGAAEAAAAKIALVQTVPVAARVANDPARATVTGENVPSNYNAPTPPPATVAAENATPVTKPADVGAKVPAEVSPAVTVPTKPVLTEKDAGYKAPPANLVDTNEKPVVPPTTDNGSVTDNWITVNPDGSGTITTPEGKPGGTLDKDTITPGGDGGIVISPDVKPIPPVDPTPDPTPDPVDPTPPPAPKTFTATVDGTTLTFGGTATGDITYTVSGETVTFKQGTLTASKTITPTELAALTSVTIQAGESLTVTDLEGFGTSGVVFKDGTVNVTASTGAKAFTLDGADLVGTFADASTRDTITVKGTVDLSGATFAADNAKPALVLAAGVNNTLTIAESLIGKVASLHGTVDNFTNHLKVTTTDGVIEAGATILAGTRVAAIDTVEFSSTTGAVALDIKPDQMSELQKASLGDGKISGVTAINVAGANPTNNAAVTYDLADFAAPATGSLDVNITLATGWASALTINGGAGNEDVSVKTAEGTAQNPSSATGKFLVNLNGGNDTLTLTDSTNSKVNFTGTLDGGADNDTLVLAGDWSGSALDKGTDIGATIDTLANNFEVLDLSKMEIANELLIKTTDATINTIIGTAKADTISGIAIANATTALTLAGANGADWMVGGAGGDTLYGGAMVGTADATYKASADSSDPLTTNATFMTAMNGKTTNEAGYLSDNAFKTLDSANILEGRGGDDKLMASDAKDVFLFQTGGAGDRQDELSFAALGADTIYGFDLGTDKLFIMDQDAIDSDGAGTDGPRGFSTDWVFGSDGALTIKGAVGTELKFTQGATEYSASDASEIYIQTLADKTVITIDSEVLAVNQQTGSADTTLTITLAGVNSAGVTTSAAAATFLGDLFDTASA